MSVRERGWLDITSGDEPVESPPTITLPIDGSPADGYRVAWLTSTREPSRWHTTSAGSAPGRR